MKKSKIIVFSGKTTRYIDPQPVLKFNAIKPTGDHKNTMRQAIKLNEGMSLIVSC